jgi:hypothetical protein
MMGFGAFQKKEFEEQKRRGNENPKPGRLKRQYKIMTEIRHHQMLEQLQDNQVLRNLDQLNLNTLRVVRGSYGNPPTSLRWM